MTMFADLLDPEPIDENHVSVHLGVAATGDAKLELYDMPHDHRVYFRLVADDVGIEHALSIIDALNAWVAHVHDLNEMTKEKKKDEDV